MKRYSQLLHEVSERFGTVQAGHGSEMQCGRGCIRCCHGLFDISLPDALHAALCLGTLPAETRTAVTARAAECHKKIAQQVPGLKAPYLLKMEDEAIVDRIVTRVPGLRCPFLGSEDACLIYEHRPLACRLEGIPMVDRRDGLFGEWCELNFTDGVSEQAQEDLLWDYYGLQQTERTSTADLSELLIGERQEAVTIFIPSLIVEYERFWAPLLARLDPADLKCRPPESQP